MVSTCSGNPVCVPPVSEFSPVSPWNSCVGLVDDCSFSSPQGRLFSSFIFCACPPRSWCVVLGFVRAGSLELLNTLRIQVTSDCCIACQSVFSSFPLTPAYSVQDIDRSPWRWMLYTITGWSGLPIPLFMFCSNLLNLWIWWHACSDVTASIFIVKWLSLCWCTPCMTMKPHHDLSLVTEPTVYAMKSYGLQFSSVRSLILESALLE